MSRRFAALFGDELAARMTFCTINSLCYRILRYFQQTTGREVFSLPEETSQRALIRELYRTQTRDYPTNFEIESLLTAVSYAKNQMLTPEEIEAMAADSFIQKNADHHPKHMTAARGRGAPVRKIELKSRRSGSFPAIQYFTTFLGCSNAIAL